MATRRMRIKAVINVNRGGANKTEASQEQPITPTVTLSVSDIVPLSPASVPSPRICSGPVSPAPSSIPGHHHGGSSFDSGGGHGGEFPFSPGGIPPRVNTPPVSSSSPHSPLPTTASSSASWKLQRPSPSKSPAGLPPSGSILRRSPSPALMSRLSSSPGPPLSPVKSPVPNYASPLSPMKHFSRAPEMPMTSSKSSSGLGSPTYHHHYPTASSPGLMDTNVKSPNFYAFRPPPSPSPSGGVGGHHDFLSLKSPPSVTRPSPAQSPVFGASRSASSPATSFLSHHFNSNSNSADSHEVAALMSANTTNVSNPSSPSVSGLFPHSPEKRPSGRDSGMSGAENTFPVGVFSNVSNNFNASPSPSFSKTIFDNPEPLKRRAEDTRKKEAAQTSATKFAAARKDFYDKLQSGQVPERNKLTMLHFTFYNPPNPNKSKSVGDRKSRSRASSICSDVSTISISKQEHEFNPPVNNENLGKASSAPSSIAGSRRTTASSVGSGGSHPASEGGQSEAGSVASNASSNPSAPGPRVKVGPDGQLIIDEKSLVVETSESQRARQQIEDMEVVSGAEYAVGSSGFYRYKKSYRRGSDWTERETVRFYRALNQCGTDFSMMQKLFPYRSRQELKSKFKREDRKNPDLISRVLQSCVFDPDEGISSEEEEDSATGKPSEVVVCSSEEPGPPGAKKKKIKIKKEKKKDMEFTSEQLQEMKANLVKGPGTGKGKKWNTPVEGLLSGKLPPPPPVKIKVEKNLLPMEGSATAAEPKPKKKYVRKKKQPVETPGSEVGSSAGATPASPFQLQPVRTSTPASPLQPARTTPIPGMVSIIMATGVLPTTPSLEVSFTGVKKEKLEMVGSSSVSAGKDSSKTAQNSDSSTASKRRSRVPKKPNVKVGDKRKGSNENETEAGFLETADKSSQPSSIITTGAGLFGGGSLFDVPSPLIPVTETILEGNEEGREDLVVVDLDELNSIQSDMAGEAQTKKVKAKSPSVPATATSSSGKRKRKINAPEVKLAATRKDPYGIADDKGILPSTSGNASSSSGGDPPAKMLKPLPYRVPGPGGAQPTSQSSAPLELELEINLSES